MHYGAGSRAEDDCAIVTIEDDLDLSSVPRVRSHLQQQLDDGWTRFVVDLTRCTFIDSTGFGLLIGCRRRAREAGGGLEIVATDPAMLRAFASSEMDRIFVMHHTVDAAVGHLVSRLASEERTS